MGKITKVTSSQQTLTLFTLSISCKMIAIICIVFIAIVQARLANHQSQLQPAPVTIDVPARSL